MTLASSTKPLAVVTGASSGIGAAFARLLARRGRDLLLVARRKDRLEALASELRATGCEVRVVPCDLSVPSQRDELCRMLTDLPSLETLVHNAGFGVTGSVGEADPGKLDDMAQVHVNATIALTSAVIPGMRARRSGCVVVVSSIAGWLHGAGSATYCATKAFQTSFTRSLAREGRAEGVKVLALCPGYTRTEFHDTPEYADWDRSNVPSWMWDIPEHVAEVAWKALESGKTVCIPGWHNRLVVMAMSSGILGLVRERIRRRGPKAGK